MGNSGKVEGVSREMDNGVVDRVTRELEDFNLEPLEALELLEGWEGFEGELPAKFAAEMREVRSKFAVASLSEEEKDRLKAETDEAIDSRDLVKILDVLGEVPYCANEGVQLVKAVVEWGSCNDMFEAYCQPGLSIEAVKIAIEGMLASPEAKEIMGQLFRETENNLQDRGVLLDLVIALNNQELAAEALDLLSADEEKNLFLFREQGVRLAREALRVDSAKDALTIVKNFFETGDSWNPIKEALVNGFAELIDEDFFGQAMGIDYGMNEMVEPIFVKKAIDGMWLDAMVDVICKADETKLCPEAVYMLCGAIGRLGEASQVERVLGSLSQDSVDFGLVVLLESFREVASVEEIDGVFFKFETSNFYKQIHQLLWPAYIGKKMRDKCREALEKPLS